MEKIIRVQKGVVAKYKNKFWGQIYSDGYCAVDDFGGIDDAIVADPRFCTRATDFTYSNEFNPHFIKLKKAVLVKIVKTTVYEVG